MMIRHHLDLLELWWNNDDQTSNNDVAAEDVIEGLKPPKNISDLRIFYYGGSKSPSWMENQSLSNLKSIQISDCNYWSIDVSFGHLPHLVSLIIERMKAVQHLGPKFFGEGAVTGFPSLEHLRISSLENWEEWRISVDNHNTRIFPRLQTLGIADCSKLKGIPFEIPPTLSELELLRSPNLAPISILPPSIKKSPSWMENQSLSNLKSIEIFGCNYWSIDVSFGHLPHLVSLIIERMKAVQHLGPKFFGEGAVTGFPSLELLLISSLENWEEWRISVDNHNTRIFPRLQRLGIAGCSKLKVIPFEIPPTVSRLNLYDSPNLAPISILPPSIEYLNIEDCEKVSNSFSSAYLEGLTSLRHIYISDCRNLKSLPPSLKAVEVLSFTNCPELKLESWMQDLTCLQTLHIVECPKAVESLLKEHIDMPSSLKDLSLEGGFSGNYDLDAGIENLRSLHEFSISGTHVVSITSWIQNLPLLSSLNIGNWQELESLDLQSLVNLKNLNITNCPKLSVSSTTLPSQLESFNIKEVSLEQLKEWLILLSSTCQGLNKLSIRRCPELIDFDVDMDDALLKLGKLEYLGLFMCCSCQSLPTQLYKFPSLHCLRLFDCPKLRSLPVNGLPSSFEILSINECPMLPVKDGIFRFSAVCCAPPSSSSTHNNG